MKKCRLILKYSNDNDVKCKLWFKYDTFEFITFKELETQAKSGVQTFIYDTTKNGGTFEYYFEPMSENYLKSDIKVLNLKGDTNYLLDSQGRQLLTIDFRKLEVRR